MMLSHRQPILFFRLVRNGWPALKDANISRLEACIGRKITADYRDFLLAVNGGYLRNFVEYRPSNETYRNVEIFMPELFFSLELPAPFRYASPEYHQSYGSELLQIAESRASDPIVIHLESGRLFQGDNEEYAESDLDVMKWTPVADSFAQYAEGFRSSTLRKMKSDCVETDELLRLIETYQHNAFEEEMARSRLALSKRERFEMLRVACNAKNAEVVECLIGHGLDVTATDYSLLAANTCSWDILRVLWENGADPEIVRTNRMRIDDSVRRQVMAFLAYYFPDAR